jgi:hypothetical protein
MHDYDGMSATSDLMGLRHVQYGHTTLVFLKSAQVIREHKPEGCGVSAVSLDRPLPQLQHHLRPSAAAATAAAADSRVFLERCMASCRFRGHSRGSSGSLHQL